MFVLSNREVDCARKNRQLWDLNVLIKSFTAMVGPNWSIAISIIIIGKMVLLPYSIDMATY